jgi:molybdopterin-containing oxidoreductase family membrane subunit
VAEPTGPNPGGPAAPHTHREAGGIGRAHAPGTPLDAYKPATEAEMQRADIALDNRLLRWMNTATPRYLLLVLFLGIIVLAGFVTWGVQMNKGIGIAGIRRPVGWGFYITNFVFWIGISHSGTLISAILRVLKVDWRTPLTRAAELMTAFALMIGALFPLIHLGRAWRFYWLTPYPNNRQLWPNFHSPLLWDMLAIFTYLTTSLLFLYLPLIPDLAALRDRTGGIRGRVYKLFSLGWRGSQQQWSRLELAMRIFTIIVIPVAVSVHSIVSWDFAMTTQPGWNSTIFAPYFVIGAIFSGTAALITVLIALRRSLGLQEYLTLRIFDRLGKMLQAIVVIWFYFFFADFLTSWYSSRPAEHAIQEMHVRGSAAPIFWSMLLFCFLIPFVLLWFKRVRMSMKLMVVITLLINVGMWEERYLIVVTSLMRNNLSYEWGTYAPHWPELVITAMTFAMFALLYVVVSKLLPMVSLWEVKHGWRVARWKREGIEEIESGLPAAPASRPASPAVGSAAGATVGGGEAP